MKRTKVLATIRRRARRRGLVVEETEGAKHTRVRAGSRTSFVPRHREIGEGLVREILRQLDLEDT